MTEAKYPLKGFKTGLKDKDGRDIEQGHIIECVSNNSKNKGRKFVVYYVPNMAGFATYEFQKSSVPIHVKKEMEYLGFGNYSETLFDFEIVGHATDQEETKHFIWIAGEVDS